MHEEWKIERSYQVIRGKNRLKIMWSEGLEREKWVWEMKSLKSIKRDRGSEIKNGDSSLYRNLINPDRSRAVEKLSKIKTHVPTVELAIEDQKRRFSTQKSSMDWGSNQAAIEETKSFLIDRTSYWELSRMW